MPCYKPLLAFYRVRDDGKKKIVFDSALAKRFYSGASFKEFDDALHIPCGRCIGCRLERARQWAVRIMHEASLYQDNCFVTLTFNDENLVKMCPNGSVDRKHMQNFMKRLRQFYDRKIRVFYCGEYGDSLDRPHYHLCLFNCDFDDKRLWSQVEGRKYFTSDNLAKIWPYGFNIISDLTFESAGYVARYCTKKVTGSVAKEHYCGRNPEFAQASLKPGIGHDWLVKFGKSDCFNHDELVVRGVKCKPPRYYDKFLEKLDPALLEQRKIERLSLASVCADDNTFDRLMVKEICVKAKVQNLIRRFDKGNI